MTPLARFLIAHSYHIYESYDICERLRFDCFALAACARHAGQDECIVAKERRCGILAEFERNGVPAAQFAQRTGLKYSTLVSWLHAIAEPSRPGVPKRCDCWRRWWTRRRTAMTKACQVWS